MKVTRENIILIVIYTVLFCTYIFPVGLINEESYTIPKLIFVGVIDLLYILNLFFTRKVSKLEITFVVLIIIIASYTKNFNYMTFITLCYLEKIIKCKNEIILALNKSKILYICLAFTLLYTICFIGSSDSRNRYAFTAIKEINQSGLAIFCLGCMLLQKNKKVGICTLIFGCLTFSRSYYLALIILIIYVFYRKKTKIDINRLKKWNYTKITIISSFALVLLGLFYIKQYEMGNITLGSNDTSRIISFLDYSNYFRFQAIIVVCMIIFSIPKNFLFGMTNEKYIELGRKISGNMGVPFRGTPPHNLFFSHLKIYGTFAFVEVYYVSNVLKKIISKNNFAIYIGIVLYSIFLGAGLYSYWLYLSAFTLIYYDYYYENKNINDKINSRIKPKRQREIV